MPNPNPKADNLHPAEYKFSKEEQSKGGKNSAKARREKRLIKDNIELLLSLPIKSKKTKEQLAELGIDDTEMNNQMAMVIAMYQKALKGDVQAFNTLRDTIGQKPIEVQELREVPVINDDID